MSCDEEWAWSCIEDAVQNDRGYDEETVLACVVRSYLLRRGLADTLTAFDAEVAPAPPKHLLDYTHDNMRDNNSSDKGDDEHAVSHMRAACRVDGGVHRRRRVQWLCLSGQYEEAAAMLPATSVVRLRLLCLAALRGQASSTEAMLYAAKHITPLVALCDDPQAAHALQLQFVATVLSSYAHEGNGSSCSGTQRRRCTAATTSSMLDCSPYDMAREANEVLLRDEQQRQRGDGSGSGPSALNVLLTWAGWLDRVATTSAA